MDRLGVKIDLRSKGYIYVKKYMDTRNVNVLLKLNEIEQDENSVFTLQYCKYVAGCIMQGLGYLNLFQYAGVEINTGPLAHGQWISCWASRICFALARLASKILKLYI